MLQLLRLSVFLRLLLKLRGSGRAVVQRGVVEKFKWEVVVIEVDMEMWQEVVVGLEDTKEMKVDMNRPEVVGMEVM